jgi:hypothetical protein
VWSVDVDWDRYDPASFQLTFKQDGQIVYVKGGKTHGGAWALKGNKIHFDVNDYSFWEGVIEGDEMTGTCTNKDDLKGTWSASRR